MRRKRRRRLVLNRKGWLLCICAGIIIGGGMVFAHIGPGVDASPKPNNPANRNTDRTTDIAQIGQALVAYINANKSLPTPLPTTSTQICTTFGADCQSMHLADLGYLMTEGWYLPGIPQDPLGGHGSWGSGFYISRVSGDQILITAPEAELGKTIQYETSL